MGGRIRHCVVEGVTDQDTITVRLGAEGKVISGESLEFGATRQDSTTTRGSIFSA